MSHASDQIGQISESLRKALPATGIGLGLCAVAWAIVHATDRLTEGERGGVR